MQLTQCSNLESLSVDNARRHESFAHSTPPRFHANEDSDSGTGARYLTDSLATLENLKTLNLDLHYTYDIRRTLGPSGTLSLAGLPNLQTLTVPLHFFVRKKSRGYEKVLSPASVLPRALNTLSIVACLDCHDAEFQDGEEDDMAWFPPPSLGHRDALIEFLGLIADSHAESFPGLKYIHYEEFFDFGELCCWCMRPAHFSDGPKHDLSRYNAVSESLIQRGIDFENYSRMFMCSIGSEF